MECSASAGRLIRCALGAVLSLVFVPPSSSAQTASASPLTLEAAIDRAVEANPTIAAARLAHAVSAAALEVAGERPNPETTVEFEREAPKQAFGFALPVELGGKRGKRIAVSQAAMHAGDAEFGATVTQVRNDVRRAYFDGVIADARLAILQELRDLSQRARDSAQSRVDSGDAPRLEVLQAELALSAAQNDAASAEGVVVAARSRLNALLGLPLDARPQLSTPIDEGGPVIAMALLDRAHGASSELLVLDRRIDEQRAKVDLARALRVPDIVPTATLTHDAQPEFTYGWRAGITVTLPLFTTHKAGVLVEETTLTLLTAQRQATQLRIDADVTAAAAVAEAQRQAYARYRDVILPQAQQVEQLAQDSYELGQTGIAALLQALAASRDARLRSLDAVSQFQTALVELERAIGTSLP
jgi:outer membrane protein, heavy metal efflux system